MEIRPILDDVARLKAQTENVSVEQLRQELDDNDDLLLIDIRELQERLLRGAIAGSRHVPRGMLEFWADPSLDYFRDFFRPERRTIVYCAGGGRSVLAARALTDMGYRNVAQLEVGFDGWRDAGEPVEDVAADSKWVRRDR